MTLVVARKLALMLALLGVTMMARQLGSMAGINSILASSALSLGFLMLFALMGGRIAKLFGAPMITGFIVSGLLAGPFILGVVDKASADNLRLVDDLAFGVIAFYAGGEMRLARFLPKIRGVLTVIVAIIVMTLPLVFTAVFTLLYMTDALKGGFDTALAGAMLISVIAITNSPAVVIGVLNETRAKGPVADLTLGVTVFNDVFVVMLFGLAMAFAGWLVPSSGANAAMPAWGAFYKIGVSFAIGALAGGIMIAFFKVVEFNAAIFIVGAAFVLAEISQAAGTNVMLSGITAGFIVENFSSEGERLMEGLRKSSMPVFALFFSLAGQSLALDSLPEVWVFAMAVVVTRLVGMRAAVKVGVKLSGGEAALARNAWAGFVGQAGLSLGLALMAGKQFPGWGETVKTIAVAVIVVNELIGPALMKRGLRLAGEIAPEEGTGHGR
jgi:Kef-type K+ transport system membrane component KefB